MSTQPFVIERTLNASVDTVWQAITDNNKMKEWYFDIGSFKPEVGFEFQFIGGDDSTKYVHLCKITDVVTGKKFCYTWRYEGFPGESKVCFELFHEDDKSRLKLTHAGLETFPSTNPAFAKESFAEGWSYIIGKSLKEYVEK